jgi:hypothetical protein
VIASTNIRRTLTASPTFVPVGDIGTPRTITVTSADPDCRVAIWMSPDGSRPGRRIIASLQGRRDESRAFLYLAYEVVAGDDDSPTVTVVGMPVGDATPVASPSNETPSTEMVLCASPLQSATLVAVAPHDLRRAPSGTAPSDEDQSALRLARAGEWASIEHAAFEDVGVTLAASPTQTPSTGRAPRARPRATKVGVASRDPNPLPPGGVWMTVEQAAAFLSLPVVTLRRSLERNARTTSEGATVAHVDGVAARKLGRLWRVWLDRGWLAPPQT